jgi:hypothetical protein
MAFSCRHLITSIALVATSLGTHAQSLISPPKEVSVRFTVFALGGMDGAAYRPRPGQPAHNLTFYSAYRSSEYEYRGVSRLEFFDARASAEGAAPVAIYDIPEGSDRLLLLFSAKRATTEDGLRYDVYGFADGVDVMPGGHFRTINLSGREYVGLSGGNRIVIPKGVGPAFSGKGTVALRLATRLDGNWITTGKYEFTMLARDRVTLILYPPASRAAVYPIMRRLVDHASDEKPPVDPSNI